MQESIFMEHEAIDFNIKCCEPQVQSWIERFWYSSIILIDGDRYDLCGVLAVMTMQSISYPHKW